MPEKFENATITGHHSGFVFDESDSGGEITCLSFSESSVFKMFFVHHRRPKREMRGNNLCK